MKYYSRLAELIERLGTVPETVDEQGRPYADVLTCEMDFTMAAGLYLQLHRLMQGEG